MDDKNMTEANGKAAEGLPRDVPYLVFEGEMVRAERHVRRLVVALVVTIVLLFASNMAWLVYESQFDTISYQQDGEGINNVNTGTQGDLLNEPDGKVQDAEGRQG